MEQELIQIFIQFNIDTSFRGFKTFNSGHINDTYLIYTDSSTSYVLQKINGNVFKNSIALIENKVAIANHLLQKGCKSIAFIPTKEGKMYIEDAKANYWCLSKYIENSQTFLQVESNDIAYEAGIATGNFLANTTDFNGNLIEILPNFHSISWRFEQFKQSLTTTSQIRKEKAQEWINFVFNHIEEMIVLDHALNKNEIPLRITHNDTKISNILFDQNKNAICLIDLDTVMKGCIHFDYGDAIRTICSTAPEDEMDLEKVNFNFNYFKHYSSGFFKFLKGKLTSREIHFLPDSPKIMTFIMGLRFLTDYLNDNIYYKVKYPNHNLDRAINQLTFVKKLQQKQKPITSFIKDFVDKC